jgi:hypothetical protein
MVELLHRSGLLILEKEGAMRTSFAIMAVSILLTVLTPAVVPIVRDCSLAADLPEGYMNLQESDRILDKTLTITLHPDLSSLSAAEKGAAERLLEAGRIFQKLYENSLHHQARSAYESLIAVDASLDSPRSTQNLLKLFYLFKGPIARTLDNDYVPIVPVDKRVPGRNVYPWGISKKEIEDYILKNPSAKASLLNLRTVVRRAEKDAILADLAALERYPSVDLLHPGLKQNLQILSTKKDETALYAVPYSVAYANDLFRVYNLLQDAAAIIEIEDEDFAEFLRQRAVDLIRDDYEAGDAAWVSGSFNNLNAQIGSYEVYDDELFAVKSFFSLSLLMKDQDKSAAIRSAIRGIQVFEESLPCAVHKKVKENIPVGVYNIIADFGQARGTNTATILPNESQITRKYGRTILLRYNIMSNPKLFAISKASWDAAVDPEQRDDYKADGNFYRTLWHEVGHYLGPTADKQDRPLDEALLEDSQVLEELKADLISLFLAKALRKQGYYDDAQVNSVYASGIRRVLLKNQPKRSQTYSTMELMQMNYYLENRLLEFDARKGKLHINYDLYPGVVTAMLKDVLALQYNGDKHAADEFIKKYSTWIPELHGVLGASMRAQEEYRYVIVRYAMVED